MEFYFYVGLAILFIFVIKFCIIDRAIEKVKSIQSQIIGDIGIIMGQLSILIMAMPKEEYKKMVEFFNIKINTKQNNINKIKEEQQSKGKSDII